MRMVIDLQGAQTESRFRGIGRYSLELSLAIARNRKQHEVLIALNGLFPETIEPIRAAFDGILPHDNIRVWQSPGQVSYHDPSNHTRRSVAEAIREGFLASLNPDTILVTSLFEGFGDDAVTSIDKLPIASAPVATILYDLIPLIRPDDNFRNNPVYQRYYADKLAFLKRSSLLLAISESAAQEAIEQLPADPTNVFAISGACNSFFRKSPVDRKTKATILKALGLKRPFIMYTGGADERKNLHRLIEAVAHLPARTRHAYQLLLAGRMPADAIESLRQTARRMRLADDGLVVAPYIDDATLLALYNTCALFVFPSFHEGFGLPPLEAMACGAAVIASNATSLPEVIGNPAALFDPFSAISIRDKINRALTEPGFRDALVTHGQRQAKSFSWDASAEKAIHAMESVSQSHFSRTSQTVTVQAATPRTVPSQRVLAIKLDHMGDFLLAIPAFQALKNRFPTATLDVLVGSWNKDLAESTQLFDNIFTFDLFRKKSSAPPELTLANAQELIGRLGEYDIALDFRRQPDSRFILALVRARHRIGYQSFNPEVDGALDISLPAEGDVPFRTTTLNETSIARQMVNIVHSIPNHLSNGPPYLAQKNGSRSSEPSVGVFPFAGNSVKEWGKEKFLLLISALCADARVAAVHVYLSSEEERASLAASPHPKMAIHVALPLHQLKEVVSQNWLCVANNSFGAHLADYLGILCLAIYGGHETVTEWAPVFSHSYIIHTDEPCSPCHIANISDCTHQLKCLNKISVDFVLSKVQQALYILRETSESAYSKRLSNALCEIGHATAEKAVVASISRLDLSRSTTSERAAFAKCLAASIPPSGRTRQLLVDISELVQSDARTGIQRATRALLQEILSNPPTSWDVRPVYALPDRAGYFHANAFARQNLEHPVNDHEDTPVEAFQGDLFLGLDLHPLVTVAQESTLHCWRNRGVHVFFVVYDLLPISLPDAFPPGVPEAHLRWLKTISMFDGALCISRAVADNLCQWLQRIDSRERRPFRVSWFHLGADVGNSMPSFGLPADFEHIIQQLQARPTFVMVGTIEPRKAYLQALTAFNNLWKQGVDLNLVIVGKEGWQSLRNEERKDIPETVDFLDRHEERGRRLFWLAGISDEFLERVYENADCLLAASYDEGFGLPIVEAAHHGLAVLARDIPVFREVAGDNATYFPDSKDAIAIERAVKRWLPTHSFATNSSGQSICQRTWRQSALQLLHTLFNSDTAYKTWPPSKIDRTQQSTALKNSTPGVPAT